MERFDDADDALDCCGQRCGFIVICSCIVLLTALLLPLLLLFSALLGSVIAAGAVLCSCCLALILSCRIA